MPRMYEANVKFQPFFFIFHFKHFSVFLVTSSSPVSVVIAYP